MSQYIYSYDDEDHDRYFEVEINYDTCEPYYGHSERGDYTISGEIYVTSVRVLLVEYYDPDGNEIAKIRRPEIINPAWRALDAEAEAIIEQWIDDGDCLCDDLWDNRG